MTFEWDESKNMENILKHNVSFEESQDAFYDESAIIYEDAPPEIEEAFARSKRIPNFIDINSLVRRDGTKPFSSTQKSQPPRVLNNAVAVVGVL